MRRGHSIEDRTPAGGGRCDVNSLLRDVLGTTPTSTIAEGTRTALAALAYRHGRHWDDDAIGEELGRIIAILRRRPEAPLELGFYAVASALLKRLQDDHGVEPSDALRSIAADLAVNDTTKRVSRWGKRNA